jgi:phasin family protein
MALAKHQVEIIFDAIEQAAGAVQELSRPDAPTEKIVESAEIARASFDKILVASRELLDLMLEANTKAFDVINKRVTEGFDELREFGVKRTKPGQADQRHASAVAPQKAIEPPRRQPVASRAGEAPAPPKAIEPTRHLVPEGAKAGQASATASIKEKLIARPHPTPTGIVGQASASAPAQNASDAPKRDAPKGVVKLKQRPRKPRKV